jgi:uncharacterized protein (DUF488 family)
MLHVWTVGHSTLGLTDFLALLRTHEIELLADIRRYPASRRHPHFNAESLAAGLVENGIAYRHLEGLGGRRGVRADSRNTLWRNASFRGYADYMETPEFQAALEELERLAAGKRTAILCSEAVWWRCHRQLVADMLTARGAEVRHITGMGEAKAHTITKGARVDAGKVTYAGEEEPRLL